MNADNKVINKLREIMVQINLSNAKNVIKLDYHENKNSHQRF